MVNLASFQKRFDGALEQLALTFTDLVLLTESLDKRVEQLEHQHAAQQDRLDYLDRQVQELRAALAKKEA
jgi:chaperonin cofactor prefoldin